MVSPGDIRILIVGTNAVYRKNFTNMLSLINVHNLEQAVDGTRAWEAMGKINPSVVIAQWKMPEMSGLALLRLIRGDSTHADTPFILWTTEITKSDVVRAGESGVSAILVEPVSIENLENKLHLILEFEMSPSTRKAKSILAKGDAHLKEEKYDLALEEYEHVLEILESAEVYYNIGYIKTARGEYDEALAAFRKATQINQMYAKAYKAMADVYIRLGKMKMAEKYLQMAGDIFLEREMHEKAESIFNEILRINPDTINVYNSLGIIYRRQNRLEEAIQLYEKAVKINPHDENVHFNMGRAYLDMGNALKAKTCFEKSLKINPDFDTAQGMLSAIEATEKPGL
ncbi:MAG: tetratricopeptide repeat protein [Desulfomonilia bacterium]